MKEIIRLQNVTKIFNPDKPNQITALDGLSLAICEGETLSIMGVSGSGKSTLLNIIGCIDEKTSGEFWFSGKEISKYNAKDYREIRKSSIGYIFQDFSLLEDFSVYDNVKLPLLQNGRRTTVELKNKVTKTLKKVGMENYFKTKVKLLSGGQKQRVAIARAIICKPSLILADEPTSALDTKTAEDIMELLLDLNKSEGLTLVVVTHDEKVAKKMAKTIHIVDGKISDGI